MLLEIAIGDAYGAGFEFIPDFEIKDKHDMSRYIASSLDDLKAGQYTDDTQMSLAIVELMINHPGEWTPTLVTEYFLKAFKRDPRPGYAKGFYNFLLEVDSAEEFIEKIHPESERNGAAMRSVPLGLIPDIDEMLIKAEMQARITHDTDAGVFSSKAIALASHYAYYKLGDMKDVTTFIMDKLLEPIDTNKDSRVACDAYETIDAVFTVLLKTETIYEVIDESVKLGGDTDSVASIACGIAALSGVYDKQLPMFFYEDLEQGEFGFDYISLKDEELKRAYPAG